MKEKIHQMKGKKIRKYSPKKNFLQEDLSSPIITNEDLLTKHPSLMSSLQSSPESTKHIPGSMLEFLLNIEELHLPLSL